MEENKDIALDIPVAEKPKKKKKKKFKLKKFIILILLVCIILGLIGAAAVAGYVYSIIKDQNNYALNIGVGDQTTYVYDKDGTLIKEFKGEKDRTVLEPTEIPLTMKQAIVSIEDQRFFYHNGVDIKRIFGAAYSNIKSGDLSGQGASTITMQVVRTCVLEVSNATKSIERKILEAWYAMKLEKMYSKEQILAYYLNNVYYGKGCYSLASAARAYFDKDVSELDLGECAFLAGVVNGPGYYDPYNHYDRAKYRQAVVLNEMTKVGYITEDEATEAKAKDLILNNKEVVDDETEEAAEVASETNINDNPYKYQSYVDYVFDEALECLNIPSSNSKLLYTGGYRIYTAMDSTSQEYAESIFNDASNFPKDGADGQIVQGAMTVVNVKDGSIVTMVGGRNISEVRGFNRATDATRQPGSSFKPLAAYGPALELGWNPGNVVDDYAGGFLTEEKVFKNDGDTYRGLVSLRTGVQRSINTVAVKLIEKNGVQNSIAFAKKCGITTLVETGSVLDAGPSVALGGLTKGVTPLEMAGAYATFANYGVYNKPFAITRIEDSNGNIIYEHVMNSTVAMKETTAYLMTDMLTTAVSSGTGTRAKLDGRQTAGKTGTTTGAVDVWFCGFTTDYAASVWMGYDKQASMNNAYGGSYCAPIFKNVMENVHRNTPKSSFTYSGDQIVSVTIDSKSGKLPSELTPSEFITTELFQKDYAPTEVSTNWVEYPVCAASGQLLTDNCPESTTKVFLRRDEPWSGEAVPEDAYLEIPTTYCTVHGGGGSSVIADSDAVSVKLYCSTNYGDVSTTVNLSWAAANTNSTTVYNVYRSLVQGAGPSEAQLVTTVSSTGSKYSDAVNTFDGTSYYYYIQAVNKLTNDVLATSNEVKVDSFGSSTVSQGVSQKTSTISLSGSVLTNGVQLLWNENTDGHNCVYQLYRSESSNVILSAETLISDNITGGDYTDTTVQKGKTYYYVLTGTDLTDNKSLGKSGTLKAPIPQ